MALKLRQVPYCKLLFFMELVKILPAEEKKQPTSSLKNKSIERGMMGLARKACLAQKRRYVAIAEDGESRANSLIR